MIRAVALSVTFLGLVACSSPEPCIGSTAVHVLIEDVRHHTGAVADLLTTERRDPPRLEQEVRRLVAGLKGLSVITASDAPDVAPRFSSAASTMIRADDGTRSRLADALADAAREFERAVESLLPPCGTANDDG